MKGQLMAQPIREVRLFGNCVHQTLTLRGKQVYMIAPQEQLANSVAVDPSDAILDSDWPPAADFRMLTC